MKKKIIDIMEKYNEYWWDHDSLTKPAEITKEESDSIDECNDNIAKEIIQLFNK
jgi:hypothetical protein